MTTFLQRRDLACLDVDPELFFPLSETGVASQEQIAEARSVCVGCPVRSECLEVALDTGAVGLWAGTTTAERRAMRRRSAAHVAEFEPAAAPAAVAAGAEEVAA